MDRTTPLYDARELHPICPLGHFMKIAKVEGKKTDCIFCKEGT